MEPDLSDLDAFLAERDLDGYLMDDDSDAAPDQRYLSGFDAPDPFVTLYTPERSALLVNALEYGRAKAESRVDAVRRGGDYDYRERFEERGAEAARAELLAAFLEEFGVGSVAVPARFPTLSADALRDQGVAVEVDGAQPSFGATDTTVSGIRAVKTDEEVEWIRESQRANEAAMRTAEALLADADVVEGVLHHDGEVLTSERVKEAIEMELLGHGCGLDETIVACGESAATPHDRGSGPLRVGESVIVDIFPRDKETGYHGDMTRTFVRGEPSDTISEWYDLTLDAMAAAFDAIEPGVAGEAVDDAVCDVYEDAGLPTLREDPEAETGFIHSTGHGVGLEVHEGPMLAQNTEDVLEPGNVVTVEPGLYDPEVGGVRVEDLVVVTEDGFENLTAYPAELVL